VFKLELALATYPLSEFAVIATSGYFRRGLSWGPVYSATTLEFTRIEDAVVMWRFAEIPTSPTTSRADTGLVLPMPTLLLVESTTRVSVSKVAAPKVVGTISADPLKFTPPIVLGVVRVAADPVVFRSSVPVVTLVAFRAVSPEPFPDMVPFTLTLRGSVAAVRIMISVSDALLCVYPISSVSVFSSKIMATLLVVAGRVSMRPRSTTGEAVLSFPISMIGSLTLKLTVSRVVVVPSTVKLPVTLMSVVVMVPTFADPCTSRG